MCVNTSSSCPGKSNKFDSLLVNGIFWHPHKTIFNLKWFYFGDECYARIEIRVAFRKIFGPTGIPIPRYPNQRTINAAWSFLDKGSIQPRGQVITPLGANAMWFLENQANQYVEIRMRKVYTYCDWYLFISSLTSYFFATWDGNTWYLWRCEYSIRYNNNDISRLPYLKANKMHGCIRRTRISAV